LPDLFAVFFGDLIRFVVFCALVIEMKAGRSKLLLVTYMIMKTIRLYVIWKPD